VKPTKIAPAIYKMYYLINAYKNLMAFIPMEEEEEEEFTTNEDE